jgi:hypothetical protein
MSKRRLEAKWTLVNSSAVRAVRYDTGRGELDIRFEEGQQYRYSNVPRSKFRALLAAKSIGAFVNREIKPRHSCHEIIHSIHPPSASSQKR